MNPSAPIVCKPTPWFMFRALVMLLMFSVFAALFYQDGASGYREKNLQFYLAHTFQQANDEFSRQNSQGQLAPDEWQRYAALQTVDFPDDRALLPASLELPMPWPEILHDYARMKPLQWNLLWIEYAEPRGWDATPREQAYDARTIREQWIFFWICLALAVATAFVLLRTRARCVIADEQALTTAHGLRVPYEDLKTLDLRKWESKGLAFLDFQGSAGKGRIRIDGLTYGGFKPENGEPAERLMQRIRSHFSGELIEYAPLAEVASHAKDSSEAP